MGYIGCVHPRGVPRRLEDARFATCAEIRPYWTNQGGRGAGSPRLASLTKTFYTVENPELISNAHDLHFFEGVLVKFQQYIAPDIMFFEGVGMGGALYFSEPPGHMGV